MLAISPIVKTPSFVNVPVESVSVKYTCWSALIFPPVTFSLTPVAVSPPPILTPSTVIETTSVPAPGVAPPILNL